MYAFPKILLPPKVGLYKRIFSPNMIFQVWVLIVWQAVEAALEAGQFPDVFYAFQLLEATGENWKKLFEWKIANTIYRFLHIIIEQVSVSSLDPGLVKQPERTTSEPQSFPRCQRQKLLNTHHQLFQEPMIKDMLGRLKEFHVKFLEKYS